MCAIRIGFAALVMAAASTGFMQDAVAADMVPVEAAPEVSIAKSASPWQIRLRALHVITRDSGYVGGVAGSGLSFSDTTVPEVDISYFFNDNIATELILGTSYARVHGEGSISGLGEVGKTWFLPPTLTLQYHFTEFGAFRPYVGAGLNYTIFYNQSGKSAQDLDVKNTFGAALQVGFDYMIDDHWGLNMDVKKLYLRPDFDVNVGGSKLGGKARLDPWLIGAGLTYRF